MKLYIICASKSEPPELAPALKVRDKPIPTIIPPNMQEVNKSVLIFCNMLSNFNVSKNTDNNTVEIIVLMLNLIPSFVSDIINSGILTIKTVIPTGKLNK